MGIGQRWQVISPLLDELLEADAAGRIELLATIRATDAGLAEEVAALLARQVAAEHAQFLEGAASGYGRRLALVGAIAEDIPLILAQLPDLARAGG